MMIMMNMKNNMIMTMTSMRKKDVYDCDKSKVEGYEDKSEEWKIHDDELITILAELLSQVSWKKLMTIHLHDDENEIYIDNREINSNSQGLRNPEFQCRI